MTWIRFETTAPDHEQWESLGRSAGVSFEAAFYHYFATLCGLAEHCSDGQIAKVSDRLLETWARWRGKTGKWARAFRQQCAEPDGEVRGWWRNAKLLERQERDRARRKTPKNPHKTRRVFPDKPAGFSADNPEETRAHSPRYGTERDETTTGEESLPLEGGETHREKMGEMVTALTDTLGTRPRRALRRGAA